MIVSPIDSAPVSPNGPAHSPDAVARAKAAFAGVQMSESDSYLDPAIAKMKNSIRTLKMKTNASPERFLAEIKAATPEVATENAKTVTDGQTNAVLEDTKPLSPQFAALARERRALQVKERELAAKEAALTQNPGGSDVIARLKQQPLSVLQEAGVTYEQLDRRAHV